MSRAERLYSYFVCGVGMSMWVAAAIIALRMVLNGLGVGPESPSGLTDNVNRELWSIAVAVGAAGLAIWSIHWLAIERSVRPAAAAAAAGGAEDASVSERRSIIRSFYLASVSVVTLAPAVMLAVELFGRSLADLLDVRQIQVGLPTTSLVPSLGVDDDWSLSIIVVLLGIWAYHVWIRHRDVRQGPVITGAAAWVSRLYLYWAAYLGLAYVLSNAGGIVSAIMSEWARPASSSADDAFSSLIAATPIGWERQVIMGLVAIVAYGAVWLAHWIYADRLRNGATEQSAQERTSRVRLAFLIWIAVYGAISVLSAAASSLSALISEVLDAGLFKAMPLWYNVATPPLAAAFAGIAWWWHRRRALAEDADGPAGVSAARVAGYAVALVGLVALTVGLASSLGSIFGEWFTRRESFPFDMTGLGDLGDLGDLSLAIPSMWKMTVSIAGAYAVAGLAIWAGPWLFAQARRAPTNEARGREIGSSSRAWYLFSVLGASVVTVAVAAALILYPYMRVTFGLTQYDLGGQISGPLGWLLVMGAVMLYHRLVLRSDRATPPDPAEMPAQPPAAA